MSTPTKLPQFEKPDLSIPNLPPKHPNLISRPRVHDSFTYHPTSRWVRGILKDTAIVDSRHQILVWEPTAAVPEYAFPTAHVRTDLLSISKETPPTRFRPKEEVQWYDLAFGDERIPAVAWKWKQAGLEDFIAFSWGAMKWYEEEEVVFAHPRSPFARIDVLPSKRHVRVLADGVELANTHNAMALFETGLPTRFYIPPEDVKWDELQAVELGTDCPYKGHCDRYWRTKAEATPIAWSYREPLHEVAGIKDLVAFYNEKLQLVVDGVPFVDSQETWG